MRRPQAPFFRVPIFGFLQIPNPHLKVPQQLFEGGEEVWKQGVCLAGNLVPVLLTYKSLPKRKGFFSTMEKRGRHRGRNRNRKQCMIGRLSIDAGSAIMPKSIPIAIAIAIPMPIPIPIVPFLRSRRFAWLRPSAALWSLSRTRTPRGGSGRDGDGGSPGLRLADLALRGSSLPVASRLGC